MKAERLIKTGKPLVAIQLDLKGVLFKPSYMPELLADLKGQGINALLVEYEDTFPFDLARGVDVSYSRADTWSPALFSRFLDVAEKNDLEVIPLQQCLGHLEYVFRWHRYRRFALDRAYPSTVDITNPKAVAIVFTLLQQVMEAHPKSRFIHLGMDEAHALVKYATAKKKDVVELFLAHLDRLCALCEHYGKIPMIWSDMLEDHISDKTLGAFKAFKDRVVLCPWDYDMPGETTKAGRIAGVRVSKAWLNEPWNNDAPAIGMGHTFIEDLTPGIRRVLGSALKGREFASMFQADLWTRMGFRVFGASSIRSSSYLSVMPNYNRMVGTIRAWGRAIKRNRQLGQVGTSWARGTTFGPPGYSTEMSWPLIAEVSRSMDVKPKPFFAGIPQRTVDRIVGTLGRCRADWRIERRVIDEMEKLLPRLKAHRYEWSSMILMARALELQRRADYNILEVDHFHANHRPPEPEWQRRLKEQQKTLKEIPVLRRKIRAHFSKRYVGVAFEEWVRDLFDFREDRIKACRAICRRKCAAARKDYAR